MRTTDFQLLDDAIRIHWGNATQTDYPLIWLRDNDPADLHPDTEERTFDLTSVSLDIQPHHCTIVNDGLELRWPDKEHDSHYEFTWLLTHQPGKKLHDPADVDQDLWNRASLKQIPRFCANACMNSDDALLDALLLVKSKGIAIFEGLPDEQLSGEKLGDLIGFKRRTNFGVTFDVVNKPEPNNLAYTALTLPLHIDLTNQESIPGYQFLHCCENTASGGESVFADGYKICADLHDNNPEFFEILSQTPLPWRFHDEDCDIRFHRPIIDQRDDGRFTQFAFNAHIMDIPDLKPKELQRFYAAYQSLMKRMRQEDYAIKHQLSSGEMVMFDNRRVLHGRSAFDPHSGSRHLRGFYVDHNEVNSRIRVLSRPKDQTVAEA